MTRQIVLLAQSCRQSGEQTGTGRDMKFNDFSSRKAPNLVIFGDLRLRLLSLLRVAKATLETSCSVLILFDGYLWNSLRCG